MEVELRGPSEVMSIAALGAVKPHRLSFSRRLIRRMTEQGWEISLSLCDVDEHGVGRMVYDIDANGHLLHFVIRSDNVPEELRTGRLSEARFDGMGILCHGPLDWGRLDREMQQIQLRSAGRGTHQSLGWTLCSRSSRSFDLVVDALCEGRQPAVEPLVGGASYLLRNNGYYGNGRHGTRPWTSLPPEHPLAEPYFPEMLALYLWRQYGHDLVDAMARKRNVGAVALDASIKRYLGVGNAKGQGMSTFLPKWPYWVDAWNSIRETAFARVAATKPSEEDVDRCRLLLQRARNAYAIDQLGLDSVFVEPHLLAGELTKLLEHLDPGKGTAWASPLAWADEHLHIEAASLFRSVLTEVHASLVDDLGGRYLVEMARRYEAGPAATIADLRKQLRSYGWVQPLVDADGFHEKFFYRSEEHGEQRVGDRAVDAGTEYETFAGVVALITSLVHAIEGRPDGELVARFLVDHANQRFAVERVLSLIDVPYAEVRADMTNSGWTAAEAGRFVLATFGMEMARVSSDRWVQGVFFQGAPLSDELATKADERDWIYPSTPAPP